MLKKFIYFIIFIILVLVAMYFLADKQESFEIQDTMKSDVSIPVSSG